MDVIDRVLLFFEEKKIERHELMVRKGYITEDIEYSDDLWKAFKDVWLSKAHL